MQKTTLTCCAIKGSTGKKKSTIRCTKVFSFLQDNVPAHKTLNVLKNSGFEYTDYPQYSPDLAPSDYFLFPNPNKYLRGRQFQNDSEVIAQTDQYINVSSMPLNASILDPCHFLYGLITFQQPPYLSSNFCSCFQHWNVHIKKNKR